MYLLKKNFLTTGIILFLFLFYSIAVTAVSGDMFSSLTLYDCLTQALQNHPMLTFAQYDLQNARWDLEKLQLEDPDWIALQDLKDKKMIIEEAEAALVETEMKLISEIESSYFKVLTAVQTVKSRERSLGWTKKRLEIIEIKYEGGLIPKKDLCIMEERYREEEKEVDKAYFQLETARMALNQVMAWKLEKQFELVEEQVPFKLLEIDLKEAVQSALDCDHDMKQSRQNLLAAEADLDLKKKTKEAKIEVIKAERALEKIRFQCEKLENMIVLKVRESYLNLISCRDLVIRVKKDLEQAEKDLEILKIKYDAGKISLMELINGHTKQIEAENELIKAVYDYNLAKAGFQRLISRKDLVDSNIRVSSDTDV